MICLARSGTLLGIRTCSSAIRTHEALSNEIHSRCARTCMMVPTHCHCAFCCKLICCHSFMRSNVKNQVGQHCHANVIEFSFFLLACCSCSGSSSGFWFTFKDRQTVFKVICKGCSCSGVMDGRPPCSLFSSAMLRPMEGHMEGVVQSPHFGRADSWARQQILHARLQRTASIL